MVYKHLWGLIKGFASIKSIKNDANIEAQKMENTVYYKGIDEHPENLR